MNRPTVFVAMVIALSGCAGTPAPQSSDAADTTTRPTALAGLEAAGTVTRVDPAQVTRITGTRRMILLHQSRDHVYAADVAADCPVDRYDPLIVIESRTSQYCTGDFVKLRARTGGQLLGTCSLGAITEYRKTPAPG